MLSYDEIDGIEEIAQPTTGLSASAREWRNYVMALIAHARGQDAEIRRLQRVEEKARDLVESTRGLFERGTAIVPEAIKFTRDALAAALEESK